MGFWDIVNGGPPVKAPKKYRRVEGKGKSR